MSDLGRKNISDKVDETLTPNQDKSGLDKAKETVTDKADDLAAKATPEDQKSFSQTIADNVKQGHDDAKSKATTDKASVDETAKSYIDTAKEQAGAAANYISGVVTGAAEGAKSGHESSKK